MKISELIKAQCILNKGKVSFEDIREVKRLFDYLEANELVDVVTLELLNRLFPDNVDTEEPDVFSENDFEDDAVTTDALELLYEVSETHNRTYTPLEHKLIETGVMSGRCFVCWHENTFYPGSTVDNLRKMGFDRFYNTYKGNWEKIKDFRRTIYSSRREK